jgi:hypothetical protein
MEDQSIRIPDRISPIYAYRIWELTIGCNLIGPFTKVLWPQNHEIIATHPYTAHELEAPYPKCKCGIHGANTIEDMLNDKGIWLSLITTNYRRMIPGIVKLWGKVREHEKGWRAEFGQIVVLFLPIELEMNQKPLREKYRCYTVLYEIPIWEPIKYKYVQLTTDHIFKEKTNMSNIINSGFLHQLTDEELDDEYRIAYAQKLIKANKEFYSGIQI